MPEILTLRIRTLSTNPRWSIAAQLSAPSPTPMLSPDCTMTPVVVPSSGDGTGIEVVVGAGAGAGVGVEVGVGIAPGTASTTVTADEGLGFAALPPQLAAISAIPAQPLTRKARRRISSDMIEPHRLTRRHATSAGDITGRPGPPQPTLHACRSWHSASVRQCASVPGVVEHACMRVAKNGDLQ
jgi:hypothetical protein